MRGEFGARVDTRVAARGLLMLRFAPAHFWYILITVIFSWDDWKRDHLAEHGIAPWEAEHVVEHAQPPFPRSVTARTSCGDPRPMGVCSRLCLSIAARMNSTSSRCP